MSKIPRNAPWSWRRPPQSWPPSRHPSPRPRRTSPPPASSSRPPQLKVTVADDFPPRPVLRGRERRPPPRQHAHRHRGHPQRHGVRHPPQGRTPGHRGHGRVHPHLPRPAGRGARRHPRRRRAHDHLQGDGRAGHGGLPVGTIDIGARPGAPWAARTAVRRPRSQARPGLHQDRGRLRQGHRRHHGRAVATGRVRHRQHRAARRGRESNSAYDKPSGATNGDDARFWHQARKDADGGTRVGVWSGQWTYRGAGAPAPATGRTCRGRRSSSPPTPTATGRSAGGTAPSPSARSASPRRAARRPPTGSSPTSRSTSPARPSTLPAHPRRRQAHRARHRRPSAGSRCSRATRPRATTPRTDYGGNTNKAGGRPQDLNGLLLKGGKKYGAEFGVHVSATEACPVAEHFKDDLGEPEVARLELARPELLHRPAPRHHQRRPRRPLQAAARTRPTRTSPHVCVDVYYTHGWIAEKTADAINGQGWNLATEWADKFERQSLWSHWANDDSRLRRRHGQGPQLRRSSGFIRSGEKDVWNNDGPRPVRPQSGARAGPVGTTGTTSTPASGSATLPPSTSSTRRSPAGTARHHASPAACTAPSRTAPAPSTTTAARSSTATATCCPGTRAESSTHYNKSGGTTGWARARRLVHVYRHHRRRPREDRHRAHRLHRKLTRQGRGRTAVRSPTRPTARPARATRLGRGTGLKDRPSTTRG